MMKRLLLTCIVLSVGAGAAFAQNTLPKKHAALVKNTSQKQVQKPARTQAEAQALKDKRIAEKRAGKKASAEKIPGIEQNIQKVN